MTTNKSGMGGQEQRGGTGVVDEEKKHEYEKKGGKEQGKFGQNKPEQGKQDFRHQDKSGKYEHSNEEKK